MAMGEQINYPEDHLRRAWDLIAIITYIMMLSLFGRNFQIKEISLDKSQWKSRRFVMLKMIRRALDIPIMRSIYKKMFRVMVPVLKSKREWK